MRRFCAIFEELRHNTKMNHAMTTIIRTSLKEQKDYVIFHFPNGKIRKNVMETHSLAYNFHKKRI